MLKNYTKIKVDKDGTKRYLNDEEKPHRLDGPAFEWLNGSKEWVINGKDHRNIDSSVEYGNGSKYWWFKDKYHRIGGSSYSKFETWYIHGKEYTKQEYFNVVWDI